nr:hypothetical protein [Pseudenhygromyxa sp. WMMC2535]
MAANIDPLRDEQVELPTLGEGGEAVAEDLLQPILRAGARVWTPPPITESRERALAELASLPAAVRDLDEPATYPVAIESRLAACKRELIARMRAH